MQHRAFRTPANFEVTLHTRTGMTRARLVNIHKGGAELEYQPGNIDLFSPVAVEVRAHLAAADVVWMYGYRIGLRFQIALSPRVLSQLARQKRSTGVESGSHRLRPTEWRLPKGQSRVDLSPSRAFAHQTA